MQGPIEEGDRKGRPAQGALQERERLFRAQGVLLRPRAEPLGLRGQRREGQRGEDREGVDPLADEQLPGLGISAAR